MLTPSTGPITQAGSNATAGVPAAADALCPHPANVLSVRPEAPHVATFSIAFQDAERQSGFHIQPGQFNMIYVPGVGEVPISVSHLTGEGPGIGHTIRFTGRVTNAIGKLTAGAVVGLRGPYGRGWPIEQCARPRRAFGDRRPGAGSHAPGGAGAFGGPCRVWPHHPASRRPAADRSALCRGVSRVGSDRASSF